MSAFLTRKGLVQILCLPFVELRLQEGEVGHSPPMPAALCKEYSHCSLLWPQASPRHSGQTLIVLFDAVPALASWRLLDAVEE